MWYLNKGVYPGPFTCPQAFWGLWQERSQAGTAAICQIVLTTLACMCRPSDSAQAQHHGSTASALSLALHMVQCATAGRAASPSQGCSAPGVPQMSQGNVKTSPVHILLLTAEGALQVLASRQVLNTQL